MKIGVEASALARANRTGVDFYTFSLLKAMADLDPGNTFILPYLYFFSKPAPDMGFGDRKNIIQRRISYLPGKVYNGLFRYLVAPPIDLLGLAPADVYLFPNFVRWPLIFTRKSAVVVYDLSFIHSSTTSAARLRSYLTKFVPKAVHKAQVVITISENSKKEIIEAYHVDPNKIVVAPPAVDHSVFYPRTAEEASATLEKYGVSDRSYILFTGTIEPRKNLSGLLDAYEFLPDELREEYPLVLAGGKGWLDDEIHGRIESLRSRGMQIVQTGYVPFDELPLLYSRAKVFAFPSLYEGFGMPPLEAMACGTPVVTSDNSSLPEVVGDAGMMVEATNSHAIAAALQDLLTNSSNYEKLNRLGLQQVQRFSWETSAKLVLDRLEELGGRVS